ncbi:rod-binding protein [Thermocrinis jamiesonii]|jgi:Rod binding protein|uniref:rod-binding protein n=1 Tax=Thermocrinis jamiesonii TaxID=1302351 RepID=UPI00049735FD|nr:rod-binding protein [Thermocrinis jamiesonii]
MDLKIYLPPSLNYLQDYTKDKKKLAQEFESIFIKELLKEGFRSLTKGKGFQQQIYYDLFLENLSRHLAQSGGIGIAQFILGNLNDKP